MASEILGLFTSPEDYQQQRDLMMQRQAAEMARLDPFQSIRYNAIRAGQRFGQGLASVLGAEDPQLRMISARQSALRGINLGDPESIFTAAQQLADAGDQQGALTLADYGRKAQADAALVAQRQREGRVANEPEKVRIARTRADLMQKRREIEALPPDAEGRDRALQMVNDTLAGLPETDDVPKFGEKVEGKSFELFDKPYSQLTTAERKSVNDAIRVEGEKADKAPAYGTDREAESMARYGKRFGELTQTQQAAVNRAVDQQAEKVAPRFSMTGQKEPIDIPKYRKTLLESLDPYKSTIDAGDNAIVLLNQAKATNNASSFNAGITELAKMTQGGGRLSNQDVELARKDPALISRATDMIANAVFGRPSKYTIDDILSTVNTLREVAANKYSREITKQRKIAAKAKIDEDTINILFDDTAIPTVPSVGKSGTGAKQKSWSDLPEKK
jgi:hypothetical protein